jgi:hypothetical protein
MFLRSLTLAVILITVGFQTASGIVMGVSDGRVVTFYVTNKIHALVWAYREVSTRPEFATVRAQTAKFRNYLC